MTNEAPNVVGIPAMAFSWLSVAFGCPAGVGLVGEEWKCGRPERCKGDAWKCWHRHIHEEFQANGEGKGDDLEAFGAFLLDWLALWLGCPLVSAHVACHHHGECKEPGGDMAPTCWKEFFGGLLAQKGK